MNIKQQTKSIFEKVTGLTFYKKLPFGLDVLGDIKFRMKEHNFQTLFDVGANRGQTAKYMRKKFPEAKIYCFEPIKDTYELLREKTTRLGLSYYNLALGAESGEVEVKVDVQNRNSTRNTLIEENTVHDPSAVKIEKVQVVRLTDFCKTNNIEKIDYLKIDTEGYDLEVLKGATEMLENASIAFIQAEVSMNPKNTFHVDFVEVKNFLEKYKYVLFGIYEQKQQRGIPMLRRSNVVFVSEKLVKKAKQGKKFVQDSPPQTREVTTHKYQENASS